MKTVTLAVLLLLIAVVLYLVYRKREYFAMPKKDGKAKKDGKPLAGAKAAAPGAPGALAK